MSPSRSALWAAAVVAAASAVAGQVDPKELAPKDPGSFNNEQFDAQAVPPGGRHSHAMCVLESRRVTSTGQFNPQSPVQYEQLVLNSFGMSSSDYSTCVPFLELYTVNNQDQLNIRLPRTQPAVPPACRHGHSMTAHAGMGAAMIFGGHKETMAPPTTGWPTGSVPAYETRFEDTNELLLFDTLSWQWVEGVDASSALRPAARREHTAVIQNGDLLVYGGVNDAHLGAPDQQRSVGTVFGDVWRYSPPSRQWSLDLTGAAAGAGARFGHTAVPYLNKGFIVFGGATQTGRQMRDMWLYDANQQAWQAIKQNSFRTPSERKDHGAVLARAGRVMIIHGGESSGTALQDTWYYDVECGNWFEIDPNGNTGNIAKFSMDLYEEGRAYLFGGRNNNNAVRDDLFRFDLPLEPESHDCFGEVPSQDNNFGRPNEANAADSTTATATTVAAAAAAVVVGAGAA